MKGRRPFTIFIVEDNLFYTFFLNEFLKDYGNFSITTFENAENCMNEMDTQPDVVIQDYLLGNGMNGGDAFHAMRKKYPGIPVIMLSAQKDVQVAVDLLQEGLYTYIEKKDRQAFDKLKEAILTISSR
jgi:DNA-binding NtrC family response regulator